ncbi:acetyltransferase [Gemmatimonas sp.]|uniref:acetyltransferase n=1 Tax=Gemmatimonas sp. TaxID=1962908 RepID=UPI0039836EC0
MNDIVIYGAGGMGREVAQLLADLNEREPTWSVLGYISDDDSIHGTTSGDLPVIGGGAWVRARTQPIAVAFGVGSPALKRILVERVRAPHVSFPTLVHPTVIMGRRVSLGEGTIVCAASVITVDIHVGAFSTVNLCCTITHDAVLGEYTTLAPSVNVSGNVTIGNGTDIGTGSKVIQGVSIGEWSIVGAGAVVSRDLPANVTAVGVPAKAIKERPSGWYRDDHA